MKPNLTDPGKVVITIATTGGLHGRESNPALPEQPKDIIQNFRDCYNAGATVAHMHVRDKRGVTTAAIGVYGEVIEGVMSRCPGMITQVGNGIGLRYENPERGRRALHAGRADEPAQHPTHSRTSSRSTSAPSISSTRTPNSCFPTRKGGTPNSSPAAKSAAFATSSRSTTSAISRMPSI